MLRGASGYAPGSIGVCSRSIEGLAGGACVACALGVFLECFGGVLLVDGSVWVVGDVLQYSVLGRCCFVLCWYSGDVGLLCVFLSTVWTLGLKVSGARFDNFVSLWCWLVSGGKGCQELTCL